MSFERPKNEANMGETVSTYTHSMCGICLGCYTHPCNCQISILHIANENKYISIHHYTAASKMTNTLITQRSMNQVVVLTLIWIMAYYYR